MSCWTSFVLAWTGSTILCGAFLPLGLLLPKRNMLVVIFLTGVFSWLLSGKVSRDK